MHRRHQVFISIAPSLAIQGSLVFSGVLSARLLGPELRGYLTLAALLPGVVAAVAYVGLANALAYFTAREPASAPNLLASSLRLGVPMAAGALVANILLFGLLFRDDQPGILAATLPSILVAPALVIQVIAAAHLQGLGRYHAMNIVRVAPYALYAAGVTVCYVLQVPSLSRVIWAYTLAYGTVAIASIVVMRHSLARVDRSIASVPYRAMLRFGAQGFAVSLSPIETFRADQLLVGAVLPAPELAYYSVATAFSVLPRLLTQSLGLTASSEVAGSSDAQRRATARGFFITAVLLVVITVVATEALLPMLISVLFGEAFLPALAASRVLLLAAAVIGLRRLVTDLVRGLGRPGVESIAEITSWPLLLAGGALVLGAGALGGGIEAVAAVVLAASTVSLVVALSYLAHATRQSPVAAAGKPSR